MSWQIAPTPPKQQQGEQLSQFLDLRSAGKKWSTLRLRPPCTRCRGPVWSGPPPGSRPGSQSIFLQEKKARRFTVCQKNIWNKYMKYMTKNDVPFRLLVPPWPGEWFPGSGKRSPELQKPNLACRVWVKKRFVKIIYSTKIHGKCFIPSTPRPCLPPPAPRRPARPTRGGRPASLQAREWGRHTPLFAI